MGHALDRDLVHDSQHGLDVDLRGGQQGLAQGLVHAVKCLFQHIGVVVNVKNFAHQRETVGVYARGGQGDDDIARLHRGVVQNLCLVHDADGEAGQVVLVLGHHAGVLGGLAAYEGAARLDAAFGHALDDLGNLLRDVLAAGDVVEENQRLGTGADDVVDAHGHAVDADGVMLVQQHGDAQLGADAVSAGNQNGMLHAGAVQLKQTAEAAQTADAALGHRAGYILLHQLNRAVPGGNIHACSGVAGRIAFFHVELLNVLHYSENRVAAASSLSPALRATSLAEGGKEAWPPLRGGSARRRWGREVCATAALPSL